MDGCRIRDKNSTTKTLLWQLCNFCCLLKAIFVTFFAAIKLFLPNMRFFYFEIYFANNEDRVIETIPLLVPLTGAQERWINYV